MAELLERLAERGTALCEAQIGMARAELARDFEGRVRRLRVILAAMLLVMCGLQLLVVTLVLALATRLDGWLAALLVSVPLLIAGTTLLMTARSRVGAPLLEKTREALKDDLRWLKARTLTRRPAGRADEVERMRQRVDDLRAEIERDVFELQNRFRATFDIRRQISKHPFVAAAVALGGLLVVAKIVKSLLRGARRPQAVAPRRRARC